MPNKKKRPHGHYCKICGEHKANEKFSGKGHANHICKACSSLPAAAKAESQTMNRLLNMPMRRLTDSEKKWLEKHTLAATAIIRYPAEPENIDLTLSIQRAYVAHLGLGYRGSRRDLGW